jgi:hypothetical protein
MSYMYGHTGSGHSEAPDQHTFAAQWTAVKSLPYPGAHFDFATRRRLGAEALRALSLVEKYQPKYSSITPSGQPFMSPSIHPQAPCALTQTRKGQMLTPHSLPLLTASLSTSSRARACAHQSSSLQLCPRSPWFRAPPNCLPGTCRILSGPSELASSSSTANLARRLVAAWDISARSRATLRILW